MGDNSNYEHKLNMVSAKEECTPKHSGETRFALFRLNVFSFTVAAHFTLQKAGY